MPIKNQDHIRLAQEKLQFKYATNEIRRPKPGSVNLSVKKKGMLDDIDKQSKASPAPWKYDIRQKWLTGFKSSYIKENVSQSNQKLNFKWLDVPAEQQQIEKLERVRQGKIDMSTKKYTFIDCVIMDNTKKDYPRPSPAQYYMDKKGAKKYYSENEDLVLQKINDEKSPAGDRLS